MTAAGIDLADLLFTLARHMRARGLADDLAAQAQRLAEAINVRRSMSRRDTLAAVEAIPELPGSEARSPKPFDATAVVRHCVIALARTLIRPLWRGRLARIAQFPHF